MVKRLAGKGMKAVIAVMQQHGRSCAAQNDFQDVRDDPKVIAAYLGADETEAIAVMETGT